LPSSKAVTKLQALIIAIILVVVVIAGVYLYQQTVTPPPPTGPIKIGLVAIMASPIGVSDKVAMEIAIEEINKQGGILGRPLELIVKDWKREVPLGVAAYKDLVMKEGCLVVVVETSELTSACLEEGAKLYPEYPHILMSTYSASVWEYNIKVYKEYDKYKFYFNPYGVTTSTQYWVYEHMHPELVGDVMGVKKVALLIEDAMWTTPHRKGIPGLYPTLKEALEKQGFDVVFYSEISAGEKMFLPIFEKIAASDAELIILTSAYVDTVTFAKQWAESPAKDIPILFGTGACNWKAFWNLTGGACLGTLTWEPEVDAPITEKTLKFIQAMREKGVGLHTGTWAAYDLVYALKAACEKAGTTEDVEAIIKALEEIEIVGVKGTVKFDDWHRIPTGAYVTPIGQFQEDGKLIVVWPEWLREKTNPEDHYKTLEELRKA